MKTTHSPHLHRNTWFSALLLALMIVFFYATILSISKGYLVNDFAKFYASAENYLHGKSIYAPVAYDHFGEIPQKIKVKLTREVMHPNLNPPFQTLLILPLARLPAQQAHMIWSAVNLLLALVAGELVFLELRDKLGRGWNRFQVLLLLFFYFPTFASITLGQITFLGLWLLVILWACARKERDAWAGVALGVLVSIKIYFGLFLLLFLVLRRWKVLVWAVAILLTCSLLGWIVFGKEVYLDFLANIEGITWFSASWNASLLGYLSRLFGGSENRPLIDLPWLGSWLGYGASLGALLWLAWLTRQTRQAFTQNRFDLCFSLAIVVMLLASPLGWMYYFPYLIIPMLVAWITAGDAKDRKLQGLVILGWVLSTIPHQMVPAADITPWHSFIWAGAYSYALCVFQWVISRLLRPMPQTA